MLTNEYPIVSSNLSAGYGVFGTADPYNASAPNLGALNPPGSLWTIPSPSQSSISLTSTHGFGSFMTVKYVLYYGASTSSTIVNGPGPVYYTDETFTTVSAVYSESVALDAGCAGWLLPNSGTVTGSGIGTTLWTSAVLKNNGLGSWVFIAVEGFVPKARLTAGAIGNSVAGASGSWTVAINSTPYSLRTCAYIIGAVSSNVADILVTLGQY
jgi:hypothetical protein